MKFYANPYRIGVTGFYFESYKEFTEKSIGYFVEELEIEVVEGTSDEIELVNSIGINKGNMEDVIEYIETSDKKDWPAMFFLMYNDIVDDIDDAKDKVSEVCITESNVIHSDKEHNLREFNFGGKIYTCTNANCL